MPIYIYKAKDGPTKIITGDIEADTRDSAITKLNKRGYFPITIYEKSSSKENIFNIYFKRIKRTHIVTFTRQMADLIDAGIPIFKALMIVREQTENFKFRNIMLEIANKVREGQGLSVALSGYPRFFSNLYVALVKSGELGGNLDSVLLHLADLLEKEDDLKSRVKSAMAYPLLMILIGIVTISVLITWVIPKLIYMFEEIGQVLPLPTRILLGVSRISSDYWWLFLIIVIILFFMYRRIANTDEGRKHIDEIKLKVPVFNQFIIKREIARFSRTLGTLLGSGVEMISSIKATADIVANKIIGEQISGIALKVQEGIRLTDALRSIEQFPVLVPNMIAVGEESGHLDEILIKIANSYERKLDYAIKTMTNLLEPTIILIMGLIIGFIVISILLPIFTIDFASW